MTLFMIIAVLAVAIGIVLTIQNRGAAPGAVQPTLPSRTQGFDDAQMYMQTCLKESAKAAVAQLSETGDIMGLKTEKLGRGRWRAVFSASSDVPTVDRALEGLRESFLFISSDCLKGWDFPYTLGDQDTDTKLDHINGRIRFMTYPISASSGEQSRTFDPFVNTVDYPLERYLEEARSEMDALTMTPHQVNMSAFLAINGQYTIRQLDDGKMDITISLDDVPGTSYSYIAEVPK